MEELKFVLFYPVSICISGKDFKYGIKKGTFYPCLLGIIKDDNTLVDVISGRKFDVVEENKPFTNITFKSKIVDNPVFVCRNIDNSLENVKFIEEYITAKGKISPDKINAHEAFSHRLNRLLSMKEDSIFGIKDHSGFWDSLHSYKSAKFYLRKIDIENLKSIEIFSYIQSGQKDIDDKHEKNEIVLRLRNKLLKK